MTNFIIPAIITLIISITSGLLLDYYKNLAPKILGNVQNGIPIEMNSKKLCSYIVTVSNPSNKTIHELTLNIQSSQTNLKSTGATITKGLKFDSSIKDNILEIYIPFLSKGDKFSVTAYVENEYEVHNKPVLIIRSPENFNQIDSLKQKGSPLLWFNIPRNINQVILKAVQRIKRIFSNTKDRKILSKNKKPSKNKKAVIITVSIILFMLIGVLEKFYFGSMSTNLKTPTAKITVPKQSTKTGLEAGTTGVTGETGSTTGTTDATKSTGSTTENTGETKSTETKTGTAGAKVSTDETTGTAGSTGSTTGTAGSTTGTTDSTGGKTGVGGSTGSTTGTSDSKNGTTGSTGLTTGTTNSTGGTTGTTSSTEPSDGTTETAGN